jgi:hypothetical protein
MQINRGSRQFAATVHGINLWDEIMNGLGDESDLIY